MTISVAVDVRLSAERTRIRDAIRVFRLEHVEPHSADDGRKHEFT